MGRRPPAWMPRAARGHGGVKYGGTVQGRPPSPLGPKEAPRRSRVQQAGRDRTAARGALQSRQQRDDRLPPALRRPAGAECRRRDETWPQMKGGSGPGPRGRRVMKQFCGVLTPPPPRRASAASCATAAPRASRAPRGRGAAGRPRPPPRPRRRPAPPRRASRGIPEQNQMHVKWPEATVRPPRPPPPPPAPAAPPSIEGGALKAYGASRGARNRIGGRPLPPAPPLRRRARRSRK